MANRTSRTRGGDAPLSSARNPNPAAAGLPEARTTTKCSSAARSPSIDPRQELYEFWRDFRNLPLFMENIESVTILDGNRSHWVVTGAGGSDRGVGLGASRKTCPAK